MKKTGKSAHKVVNRKCCKREDALNPIVNWQNKEEQGNESNRHRTKLPYR